MQLTDRRDFLGVGIYSVPEAAKLAGVPEERLRRWLRGYDYRTSAGPRHRAPMWKGDLAQVDFTTALSFLDLIEARFVDAFLRAGVAWNALRRARQEAEKIVGHPHPFCTNSFVTDGKNILRDLKRFGHDKGLDEIVTRQGCFDEIVRPMLLQLDFGGGETLRRWCPLGLDRRVVLDPQRSFGRPIVRDEGVPTSVLVAALAGNSAKEVARWYGVSPTSIADAVEFQKQLAA